MAVPKYRTSKSKKNMRRSHHHLRVVRGVVCSITGEYKPVHAVNADGGGTRADRKSNQKASENFSQTPKMSLKNKRSMRAVQNITSQVKAALAAYEI